MSGFSKAPSFKSVAEPNPASELVLRLVAIDSGVWFPQGACTIIARHLAMTAKHVLEDFCTKHQVTQSADGVQAQFGIWAIQILDSPLRYGIWEVDEAFASPLTDIALLHLMPYNDAAGEYVLSGSQKQILLNLFAPAVGERVVGHGFHSSEAKMSKNPDGSDHIDVNDAPAATVGEVREIHVERRDLVRLNFPCFRLNARFDGGMSGGPVFNDTGQMCGVICSSMPANDDNEEHVSYAASLWPAMGIVIRGHRGQNHPKDITYPALDLAREGIIGALGWQRVELDPFEVAGAPGRIVYGAKYR